MGRPRKPTSKLISMDHNRGRFEAQGRGREFEPIGELGEYVHKSASDPEEAFQDCWRELHDMAPYLTNSDRWVVEIACRSMVRFRACVCTSSDTANLINALSRLGLTPADRSKIGVPKEIKKENRFSKLATGE